MTVQTRLFEPKKNGSKQTGVIYQPSGRAGEYSKWALNVYKGCTHGCFYCYGPGAAFRNDQDFFTDPVTTVRVLERLEKDRQKFTEAQRRTRFQVYHKVIKLKKRQNPTTRKKK